MTPSTHTKADRELNQQQEAFVLHYTSAPGAIGNAAEAARRAGYAEKSAKELGAQLLNKPHVRKAIFEANRAAISGSLSTKAVALLERVLDDENAPLKTRVEAAKTVLDRAGFVAAVVSQENSYLKPLAEMTRAELEAVVVRGAEVVKMADDFARQAQKPN